MGSFLPLSKTEEALNKKGPEKFSFQLLFHYYLWLEDTSSHQDLEILVLYTNNVNCIQREITTLNNLLYAVM